MGLKSGFNKNIGLAVFSLLWTEPAETVKNVQRKG